MQKATEWERVGESSRRVAVRPFFAHALGEVFTGGVAKETSLVSYILTLAMLSAGSEYHPKVHVAWLA